MKPGRDNTGIAQKLEKVKYLVYVMEKSIGAMDETHTGVEKLAFIIDYSNFSQLSGMSLGKVSLEILDILQNHYPERLGYAFIVHAPLMFEFFWKVGFVFPNQLL